MTLSIVHRVRISAPHTHTLEVESSIAFEGEVSGEALVVFLPVWTPGSYLVREYARHIEGLAADAPARARKIRKNAWRIDTHGARRVVVRYRVYANELTVRTSHVDETHAFLVGASIFLGVEGRLDVPARIEIDAPAGWRTATALPQVDGRLVAADFDTLVDSPIEIGTQHEERFAVLGKAHRYAIWPRDGVPDGRLAELVRDTATIIEQEARLFGGALPYESYDLLLHISPRARGGLEHRSCAALVASPGSFATRDGYLDLLSLVAHEVLHAWNIKRIRPAALTPYRYEEECYTRLLWWFEGATSFYDWRVLVLSRLCTVREYLDHLAAEIAYVEATPGRLVHALEDTSYDAWIKLYRPDENSVNSTVSYYRKGEVVCALLDLEIRGRTAGRASLDTVLARLWAEYGVRERPVPEDALQGIFERAAGVPLGDLFDAWIRSPSEIDMGAPLARVGLKIEPAPRSDAAPCSLGIRVRADAGRAVVASVPRDSAAARAGIDPGDELLGIGGLRVDGANVDAALRARSAGEAVDVLVARDGRLLTRRATLDPARPERLKIVARRDASPAARAALEAWLGRPHPAWEEEEKAP
jgi:predicted metalloprotease with PDZ domain